MWSTKSILLLFSLMLVSACASTAGSGDSPLPPTESAPTSEPVDGSLTVIPDQHHQTIDGFGASAAWWAQDVGGWEPEVRDEIVRLLFDQQSGIGLSIYRYNIGGGDGERIPDKWRRAETFEVAQGEYDWTRDANAIWFLKAAHQAGVKNFVAFAVSPPARMTVSGSTNADPDSLSNLPPEMYGQFAQYLVDVVRHLQDEEGIPIQTLSPINEPQWDWLMDSGQEGCHYEPAEVAALSKVIIQTLQANQLDVRLSLFEAGEWWNSSQAYLDPILGDPEIAPHIDHLAIHSYWTTTADKERLVSYLSDKYPGTAIEMTEWTEMEQGRDIHIDSALTLANTIHEDLTIGSVISWQYWVAVSKYNYHDGLVYVAVNDHEITETKRLWAMGNFSRFVRPGYVRTAVDSDLQELRSVAFQSPDASRYILIVINNSDSPLTVSLEGIPSGFSQVSAYETSRDHNLAESDRGALTPSFTFSPESITTLVYQK